MNIDLSPIMQAVEDVIARHERYIGYCKARDDRAKARLDQKMAAIANVYQDAGRCMESVPRYQSLAVHGAVLARISALIGTPYCLFLTDKTELDPSRQRSYYRARRATTVSINVKAVSGAWDDRGIVDLLKAELKGATLK